MISGQTCDIDGVRHTTRGVLCVFSYGGAGTGSAGGGWLRAVHLVVGLLSTMVPVLVP